VTAPLFVRALRNEPVERFPVWMMRQAGRYLPGYRAVRAKTPFLDLCRSPELAAQVSLEPVELFDVDAAIVFADILLTADAMGAPVEFDDGGPKLSRPVRSAADAAMLTAPDARRVAPTMEAITRIRKALPPTKAVIGFSAAPFTLAAYLVEGGTSRDFNATRKFLYTDRAGFSTLLDRTAAALTPYLKDQWRAGADVLMLFDTWGGVVSAEDYRTLVAPAAQRVIEGLGTDRPPTILFAGLGAGERLEVAAATGASAISLDWRTDLGDAYRRVGSRVRLQGNFDPAALYAPPETIAARVHAMLDTVPAGRPHLVNLGHGILPDIPPDHAAAFVRAAQSYRPRSAKP
jgi:uroporphyrinogen decarboxylase